LNTIAHKDILSAHTERFACKSFKKESKITDKDLRFILEIARLSPSSIGLEPWKFLVIKDKQLREKLRPSCWDQKQITEASDLIAILSRTKKSLFEHNYIKEHFIARDKEYARYIDFINTLPNIDEWTKRQCYIALANIMSSAKMIGIDSCAIEGFNSSKEIAEILDIDTEQFDVAVMVTLGYRDMPITPKSRLEFDTVVQMLT